MTEKKKTMISNIPLYPLPIASYSKANVDTKKLSLKSIYSQNLNMATEIIFYKYDNSFSAMFPILPWENVTNPIQFAKQNHPDGRLKKQIAG